MTKRPEVLFEEVLKDRFPKIVGVKFSSGKWMHRFNDINYYSCYK